MLNELAKKIHANSCDKGFYNDCFSLRSSIRNAPLNEQQALNKAIDSQRLMLIVSELSEALEAMRANNYCKAYDLEVAYEIYEDDGVADVVFTEYIKDTVQDEIADTIIRLLDFCAFKGIDIDKHVTLKMAYNSSRPPKHDKEF